MQTSYHTGSDNSLATEVSDVPIFYKKPSFLVGILILIVGSLFWFSQGTDSPSSSTQFLVGASGSYMTPKPFIFPPLFRMAFEFEIEDKRGKVRGYGNWIYDWQNGDDQLTIRGDDVYDQTATHDDFPLYDGISGSPNQYKYWSLAMDGTMSCVAVPFIPFNRRQVEMSGNYKGVDKETFPERAHVWTFTYGVDDKLRAVLYLSDKGIPLGMKTPANPVDGKNFPAFHTQTIRITHFEPLTSVNPGSFASRPKQCNN